MQQTTSVRVTPIDEDRGASSVAVAVEPAEHPHLAVTFDYIAVPGEVLGPYGLHITQREDIRLDGWKVAGDLPRLGVAILRDLPIARWERAARLAAQLEPGQRVPWAWESAEGQQGVVARSEAAVRILHPDVDPLSGKAGARKWSKLTRFAEVVLQHQNAQLGGDPDPVGTVANLRGVSPATVRSWLYRAKLEGITPESISLSLSKGEGRSGGAEAGRSA